MENGKKKERRNPEDMEMHKKFWLTEVIRSRNGYTLMELMMVLAIISIVAQIAYTAWLDNKRRAYDASAVSDTRNLIEAVVNDMVGFEDVLYDHQPNDGRRIGARTKDGEARKPSLFLSPGVNAVIVGGTDILDTGTGLTDTTVYATLWHSGGTPWGTLTASGIREFYATIDENEELIEFTGFKVNK